MSFNHDVMQEAIINLMASKGYGYLTKWSSKADDVWRVFCDREGYVYSAQPDISIQEADKQKILMVVYDLTFIQMSNEGRLRPDVVVKNNIKNMLPDSVVFMPDTTNRHEKERVDRTKEQEKIAEDMQASIQNTIERIERINDIPKGKTVKVKNTPSSFVTR